MTDYVKEVEKFIAGDKSVAKDISYAGHTNLVTSGVGFMMQFNAAFVPRDFAQTAQFPFASIRYDRFYSKRKPALWRLNWIGNRHAQFTEWQSNAPYLANLAGSYVRVMQTDVMVYDHSIRDIQKTLDKFLKPINTEAVLTHIKNSDEYQTAVDEFIDIAMQITELALLTEQRRYWLGDLSVAGMRNLLRTTEECETWIDLLRDTYSDELDVRE